MSAKFVIGKIVREVRKAASDKVDDISEESYTELSKRNVKANITEDESILQAEEVYASKLEAAERDKASRYGRKPEKPKDDRPAPSLKDVVGEGPQAEPDTVSIHQINESIDQETLDREKARIDALEPWIKDSEGRAMFDMEGNKLVDKDKVEHELRSLNQRGQTIASTGHHADVHFLKTVYHQQYMINSGAVEFAPRGYAVFYGSKQYRKQDEIVRILFGESSGEDDVLAKEHADRVRKILDESFDIQNEPYRPHGAEPYKELKDYKLPTIHNREKIASMGKERWITFASETFLVFDELKGKYVKPSKPQLSKAFDHIMGFTVPSTKGATHFPHRFLHAVDSQSWLDYHREMGVYDLYQALNMEFSMRAEHRASMEVLGTNPTGNIRQLAEHYGLDTNTIASIERETMHATGVAERWETSTFDRKVHPPGTNIFKRMLINPDTGKLDWAKLNRRMINGLTNTRRIAGKVALKNAVISVPADMAAMMVRSGFYKTPLHRLFRSSGRALWQGLKMTGGGRHLDSTYAMMGLLTEQNAVQAGIVARTGSSGGSDIGTVHRFLNSTLWLTGFNWATSVSGLSHSIMVNEQMAFLMKTGAKWSDLGDWSSEHMARNGLSEEFYNMLAKGWETGKWTSEMDVNGIKVKWFDPEKMKLENADGSITDYGKTWMLWLTREVHNATGRANPRTQAFLYRGNKRGGWQREGVEAIAQFFQFPITVLRENYLPIIMPDGRGEWGTRAYYASAAFTTMMSFSYAAYHIKKFIRGDETAFTVPEDDEGKINEVGDVFLGSGPLGWLFSNAAVAFDERNSLIEKLATRNPASSLVADSHDVLSNAARGDFKGMFLQSGDLLPAWQYQLLFERYVSQSLKNPRGNLHRARGLTADDPKGLGMLK